MSAMQRRWNGPLMLVSKPPWYAITKKRNCVQMRSTKCKVSDIWRLRLNCYERCESRRWDRLSITVGLSQRYNVTVRCQGQFDPLEAIIVPHQITWSWYTGRWWVGCYNWYNEERTGRAPQPAQAPPRYTKCNSPPINDQCTNHPIAV